MPKTALNGSKTTLAGSIVALTAATVGLAVAFGVNLNASQQGAILTFVTALVVVAGVLHISRKVDAVQETVNGRTDALTDRTEQLAGALNDAGVPVPPKPPAAPPPESKP
jgi:hypothetical protein